MASDSVVVPAPALPPRRAGMEPGACKRTLKPSGLSVVVLASDLAVDEDEFGLNESPSNSSCRSSTGSESSTVDFGDDDFLDLEELEFMRIGGVDKEGRQIVRVVGKFLPAPVVDCKRLRAFVLRKLQQELRDGPFCVVYFHSNVQSGDNSPGIFTLRSVYETLPCEYRQRLEVLYFLHPGLRSRFLLGTFGRLFLTERLYWKIQYVSRLEFLWDYIRKGQVEVPEHVIEHDQELESRPLMDYGLETDPLQGADLSSSGASMAFNKYSASYAYR